MGLKVDEFTLSSLKSTRQLKAHVELYSIIYGTDKQSLIGKCDIPLLSTKQTPLKFNPEAMRVHLNGNSTSDKLMLLFNVYILSITNDRTLSEYQTKIEIKPKEIVNNTNYSILMKKTTDDDQISSFNIEYLKRKFSKETLLEFNIDTKSNRIQNGNLLNKHKVTNGHTKRNYKIIYQFLCNNNVKIQVKAESLFKDAQTKPFKCPFCYLNCKEFVYLLKHFTFNHFRYQVETIVSIALSLLI